jgi:hypothetical protein
MASNADQSASLRVMEKVSKKVKNFFAFLKARHAWKQACHEQRAAYFAWDRTPDGPDKWPAFRAYIDVSDRMDLAKAKMQAALGVKP